VVVGGRRDAGRLATLWRFRGLLWSFTLRELQVRYRQTWLGFAWAALQPLSLTLVATLLFGWALGVDVGGSSYALFAFTALVPWTFFQSALLGAVPSLVSNATLVRKIWFPRECLPLAVVSAVGLDLLVGIALWLVALAFLGGHVLLALAFAPLLFGVLVLMTAGAALLGSATNVRYRDVKHALPVLLQALLFASPVVYPASAVPERWQPLYFLNPLAGVMDGLRRVAIDGTAPAATPTWIGLAVSLVVFVFAYRAFTAADRTFADVV
jgi:lipopolysaccharide transport system permease protein